MIDEILDVARFFTEWPSGRGSRRREKLVGRTSAMRWMVGFNRLLRYLCIPLGAAGFLFLGDDTPWRFVAFSGGAVILAVASFLADTLAIRKGLVVVRWIPQQGKS